MIRKFQRLAELDWTARLLLFQAFLLLPFIALSLKLFGIKRTQTILAKLFPLGESPPVPDKKRQLIAYRVKTINLAASQYPTWANCLKKSLLLWSLLRRQGIDSNLRIGVNKASDEFEAHAWVEYEGVALNESGDVRSRYAMFEQPPEKGLKQL